MSGRGLLGEVAPGAVQTLVVSVCAAGSASDAREMGAFLAAKGRPCEPALPFGQWGSARFVCGGQRMVPLCVRVKGGTRALAPIS